MNTRLYSFWKDRRLFTLGAVLAALGVALAAWAIIFDPVAIILSPLMWAGAWLTFEVSGHRDAVMVKTMKTQIRELSNHWNSLGYVIPGVATKAALEFVERYPWTCRKGFVTSWDAGDPARELFGMIGIPRDPELIMVPPTPGVIIAFTGSGMISIYQMMDGKWYRGTTDADKGTFEGVLRQSFA